MLLGGLWHGASWNFVIWGGLHGVALVVERLLGVTGEPGHQSRIPKVLWWFVTFHFVCLTWVFFRASDFDTAIAYLTTLVSGEADLQHDDHPARRGHAGARRADADHSGPLVRAAWRRYYDRASLVVKVAVPFVVIFLIAVAAPGGVPPFIYFQF